MLTKITELYRLKNNYHKMGPNNSKFATAEVMKKCFLKRKFPSCKASKLFFLQLQAVKLVKIYKQQESCKLTGLFRVKVLHLCINLISYLTGVCLPDLGFLHRVQRHLEPCMSFWSTMELWRKLEVPYWGFES